jgi:hypothetical protein
MKQAGIMKPKAGYHICVMRMHSLHLPQTVTFYENAYFQESVYESFSK